MSPEALTRMGACIVLGGLAVACIPADAGYQDVRQITSARIQRDVRWYEHDASADAKLRELLAKPLNAESAVQVALLNNQGLQAAFEELGVARSRLVQALAFPNPTADAALRFDGSGRTDIELHGLIDLSELLFLPLRGGVAGAALEAAKVSVAGRVLDLAFQARIAFYEYQAAEQTLELRRSILVALLASFEAARNLHEAGNITDLSYANEQALYEESRVAYTRAEAGLRAAREELSALLGVWGRQAEWTAEPRLGDELPADDPLAKLESQAIERSLDLEIIRRRFEAAGKGANVARVRGWVPELKAGVAAEREGGEWGIGPAAAIEVPLFYQGQGEAGVALAQMRQEQKLYADTAVRIRAASRTVAARLQVAAKSAEYYKTVLLPLREQIVNDTQLQYNAMSIGVFQLLQAKRDQIETARTYVDVLREYWELRAEADQLLAGRLPRRASLTETTDSGDDAMPERGRNAGGH